MPRAVLALALWAHACHAGCPATLSAGLHMRQASVDGRTRRWYVHVPEKMPAEPRPGIVMLHGCGSSPQKFMNESRMAERSAARQWYSVFPEGTTTRADGGGLGWVAGATRSLQCHTGGLVNDVTFLRAVVADMKAALCLDAARLYEAGFSNGGQMTYNLTCEMPGDFAGFSVTEMSEDDSFFGCGLAAAQVRPMVAVCGGADAICGGTTGKYAAWVERYAAFSNCTDAPETATVSSTTTMTQYRRCGASGRQPFHAYSIRGLSHCWSGNDCCDPQCVHQDAANPDSSTNILDFFDGLPAPTAE